VATLLQPALPSAALMAELLLGAGGPKLLLPLLQRGELSLALLGLRALALLLRAASALAERRARGVVAALARAAGLPLPGGGPGGPDGLGGEAEAAGFWAAVRRALGRRHVLGDELRDALLEVRRPPAAAAARRFCRFCRCAGRAQQRAAAREPLRTT
jgi:hypothetical protein